MPVTPKKQDVILKRRWDFPETPVTFKPKVPSTEKEKGTGNSITNADRGTLNPGSTGRLTGKTAGIDQRGTNASGIVPKPTEPQLPPYWEKNEYLRELAKRNPWILKQHAQRSREWKGYSLLDETVKNTPEFRAHLDAMDFWGKNAEFVMWLSLWTFGGSAAVEMLPILLKPLALLGSFQAGVITGELGTSTSITGKPLSTRGKVERVVELAFFAISFFAANAEALPKIKGNLTVEPGGEFTPSEVSAAQYAQDLGFDVTLRRPGSTRGKDTSDLLLREEHPFISREIQADVYTPKTVKPGGIISGAAKKGSQAEAVVIDLTQTSVTREQLGDALLRVQKAGAKNIQRIIIISSTQGSH